MSASQPARHQPFPGPVPLVISETEDGFQVYSPANPREVFFVTGTPDLPACTCPDFQSNGHDPAFRCIHIAAVLPLRDDTRADEEEERRAIQGERGSAAAAPAELLPPPTSQMLLKRSVSPDGRIDSLSVEFSCPVDGSPVREIVDRAAKILGLQGQIAEQFLHPSAATNGEAQDADPDRAVSARLLSIGGMDGKWGRRLFIVVQLNGHTARIFGNPKQLSEHIKAAGFPELASQIIEGARLMVLCRVVTRPGKDPRYVEIEQVLPAERPKPQGPRRA